MLLLKWDSLLLLNRRQRMFLHLVVLEDDIETEEPLDIEMRT